VHGTRQCGEYKLLLCIGLLRHENVRQGVLKAPTGRTIRQVKRSFNKKSRQMEIPVADGNGSPVDDVVGNRLAATASG
jgi:hypothetical protein